MKRATISDAPAFLNTNDKAFWVTGWNECVAEAEAAVKQARIDALEEAKQHLVKLKEQSLAAQTKDAAPMTFADDVNKNIRLATVLLAGAIDGIESLKGTP